MNRICNNCNIAKDENNYLKDRTVRKSCYKKNRRKNNNNNLIHNQQPNIENVNNKKNNVYNPSISTYENHRHVVIGPSNVGKTHYMLKILAKKVTIHIITRSPKQYPNYKTSDELKPTNKYKGSVVIFDDMVGARNSSQIDKFFTRGRHEYLDVYYNSQSYFVLPRQSFRNNSDRLILFKQTSRNVNSIYYDIGAYDMKYDELIEMCHKAGVRDLIIFVLI